MARLEYTPRPWVQPMTEFICEVPRCFVMAGMGTGKTVGALTALDAEFLAGASEPTLVLGPLRVARKTWSREAAKWSHLSNIIVSNVVGDESDRRRALKKDASVYTCNYENLPWLMQHTEQHGWFFRRVIADESTRVKNYRGSKKVSKLGNEFVASAGAMRPRELAKIAHKKVSHWTNLSGTPAPNGLKDLWGQMWFVDGGQRLGRTYEAFKQRWFYTDYDGVTKPVPFAMEQIQNAIRDVCITIDLADYLDVAKPNINNIYVELPVKARRLYDQMEKDMYMELEGHPIEAFNAAGRTQKLLQCANGACYIDPDADNDDHPKARQWKVLHDEKLEALESLIEELAGAPLLVAYQFRSDLARILAAFPKLARHIDTERDEDDFAAGKIAVGVSHPGSLGHGVDGLQENCWNVCYFGHDWNLELYQQLIERVGPVRQMQSGKNRVVNVHHIIARGTQDELVMARRESKRSVQEILMEAMKRRKR